MADNSWDELGEEIRDIVNSAISTGDFTDLGITIGDVINGAIRAVKGGMNNGFGTTQGGQEPASHGGPYRGSAAHNGPYHGPVVHDAVYQEIPPTQTTVPALYTSRPPGRLAATLGSAAGFALMGVGLIGTGICALISGILHTFVIPTVFFAVLSGLGIGLGVSSTGRLSFLNRFQSYVRQLGQHTYIPIRVLAERTGKSVAYTVKDLQKMIDQNLFYQGHLDMENGYLILSDKAYQDYRVSQIQYERRRQEEQKLQQENARLSPECQALIEQGQGYIRRIHECNDAIPGPEISQKLDKMEQLVQRIFEEVRRNPEVASDLRRMMEYYLPTTLKLLEAYQDLDAQPVSGENISRMRQEIETAVDTMNDAFEKLLDSLFADRAWDISSDISVLNTMLAQEGLKEKDFDVNNSK